MLVCAITLLRSHVNLTYLRFRVRAAEPYTVKTMKIVYDNYVEQKSFSLDLWIFFYEPEKL